MGVVLGVVGADSVFFLYLSLLLMVSVRAGDVYTVLCYASGFSSFLSSCVLHPYCFQGTWIISLGLSQRKILNPSTSLPFLVLSHLLYPVSLLFAFLDDPFLPASAFLPGQFPNPSLHCCFPFTPVVILCLYFQKPWPWWFISPLPCQPQFLICHLFLPYPQARLLLWTAWEGCVPSLCLWTLSSPFCHQLAMHDFVFVSTRD